MATNFSSINMLGNLTAASAFEPLTVKDSTLLDLLIRDRFVGGTVGAFQPGNFATPAAPAAPSAPSTGGTSNFTLPPPLSIGHVAAGDLITAAFINKLVDALVVLNVRVANLENQLRSVNNSLTAPKAPPPVVATPVPPATVVPNFTFTLANDLATVELPAHEFETANEIKIGEIVIPRNEVTIDGGIARFNAPAALFRAGVDKTPDLSIAAAAGGPARTFAGIARPIG